ncbi:Hypothetical protein, DUF150 family [Mycoplasmopsis bovigenitalium 51080]|uniref:Ribosome assembly cofactor RimP n=1 Tax=Mycoplasmopsis bovigenitalium 51080 TaxID=1188235 RepID=N9VDU9_9BACT|nr:DUF150 domain-containing protein [Mycoplasmopsis bovigenitalium]ENY69828.1 Hypothetical protein, DUF150 family [Mycoplasmopsis bovigenitalium 51080]
MNWFESLNKEFPNEIIQANEAHIDGMFALDITVKHRDMENLETLSRKINLWLETQDISRFDSILIHSPGTDLKIDLQNINEFINEDLEIKLNKNENKVDKYIAKLLEVHDEYLLIKWNQRGNIRKIKLQKDNIFSISKYIKF